MNSVPREVNGKWYPVPCPEAVSLSQSFPTYDACLAACEAAEYCEEILAELELELGTTSPAQIRETMEAEREQGEEAGYDRGFENGKDEGMTVAEMRCEAGECEGHRLGYEKAERDAKKPA